MNASVIITDAARFEEDVLQSPLPVALLFFQDDCEQCGQLSNLFEKLSESYHEKMRFVKVHSNQNPDLKLKFKVAHTPALIFISEGHEICNRYYGVFSQKDLVKYVDLLLEKGCHSPGKSIIKCDVAIIGAGPAGLTAAIYSARNKLYTFVIESAVAGGQVGSTYHIANYPGTPGTVRGSDLMENMKQTAISFGAHIKELQEIKEVDMTGEVKIIKTTDITYHANSIIIATGAVPRALNVGKESLFRGKGIHYCATCDGPFYANSRLVVVGGGVSALEESLFLTRYASKVTIINKNPAFKAPKKYIEDAQNDPKIEIIYNAEVTDVSGDEFVQTIEVLDKVKNEKFTMEVDGIFVYIGLIPNTGLFKEVLQSSPAGYLVVNHEMATNVPGVFAAGDVVDKSIRQITTAVSDGTIAGVSVGNYLMKK